MKTSKTMSGQMIQNGIWDWSTIEFEQKDRRFAQWLHSQKTKLSKLAKLAPKTKEAQI